MTELNKLDNLIVNILKTRGPLLGSSLKKEIQEQWDVSPAYARKLIQRAADKKTIHSSKPVSFQKGQFLYHLPGQNITSAIAEAVKDKRRGLHRIGQGVYHNHYFSSADQIHKWSASITNPSFFPKNDSVSKVESDLLNLNLIKWRRMYNGVVYFGTESTEIRDQDLYYFHRSENINRLFLLEAIQWLERTNLLAWKQTFIYDELMKRIDFNGQLWDAVGYTYLFGYYQATVEQQEKSKIPSLVFMESIFHRMTYLEDIEGFITRVEMQSGRMKNHSYGSRVLPILFYSNITKDAFNLAKSKGLMMINVNDWLGEFSAELIQLLIRFPVKENNQINRFLELKSILQQQFTRAKSITRELDKLIYSIEYVQKGWKSRRHVYYNLDTLDHNIEFIADWILFDPDGNPHLCFIEEENEANDSIMVKINNQITNLKTLYKELGYHKTVNLQIFKSN